MLYMKAIKMTNSLEVADKVRKAINRLNVFGATAKHCHFETFDNCREQGYTLHAMALSVSGPTRLYISFSECRNSDDIVVYVYHHAQWGNNMPQGDLDWNDKKCFPVGEYDQAAQYILDRVMKFLYPEKG